MRGTNWGFMCSSPKVMSSSTFDSLHVLLWKHVLFLKALIVVVMILPPIFPSALQLREPKLTYLIQTPGCVIKFSCHHHNHDKLTKIQSECLTLQKS